MNIHKNARLTPRGRALLVQRVVQQGLRVEDAAQASGVSGRTAYKWLARYRLLGEAGLQDRTCRPTHCPHALAPAQVDQVLFWLLRAPDGHAKNFSLHLLPRGRFQLTRLYDVMSAYPVWGDGPHQWSPHEIKLAMALLGKNEHYAIHSIQRRHFSSTAQRVGYGSTAEPLIEEILARTPAAIAEARADLPQDFSPRVADAILGGLAHAAAALEGTAA